MPRRRAPCLGRPQAVQSALSVQDATRRHRTCTKAYYHCALDVPHHRRFSPLGPTAHPCFVYSHPSHMLLALSVHSSPPPPSSPLLSPSPPSSLLSFSPGHYHIPGAHQKGSRKSRFLLLSNERVRRPFRMHPLACTLSPLTRRLTRHLTRRLTCLTQPSLSRLSSLRLTSQYLHAAAWYCPRRLLPPPPAGPLPGR